ncbi:MAG TPA: sensor histidine kinase [Spirochaetia bacterium]|nr:sensor histidine kinase [Spirochaetia bacterium]
MRRSKIGSTRYAYLFVSVNLVLLMSFFLSMSVSVRQIDASRTRYDKLARDWYALRLTMALHAPPPAAIDEFRGFDAALTSMFESDLFIAAEKLYKPLAHSANLLLGEWKLLRPDLAGAVLAGDRVSANDTATLVDGFQTRLAEIEGTIDEFVGLEQRSIRILLYFLGATIIATIAVFFLVESELESERRAAALVQTFAHGSIDALERERERISRALHDSLAQELTLTMIEIADLTQSRSAVTEGRIQSRLRSAIDWVRDLAHELHPAEIDQLGLAGAIRAYSYDVARANTVSVDWAGRELPFTVPRIAAINIYRIVQEAVTNALRHAFPKRIGVRLEVEMNWLVLAVTDDGKGFRYPIPRSLSGRHGLGLVNMAERARMLEAELEIESAPGLGTRIVMRVPISAITNSREAPG